jgi:hypothetical protein
MTAPSEIDAALDYQHPCIECGCQPVECRCVPLGMANSPYLDRPLRTEAEARAEYLRLSAREE